MHCVYIVLDSNAPTDQSIGVLIYVLIEVLIYTQLTNQLMYQQMHYFLCLCILLYQ